MLGKDSRQINVVVHVDVLAALELRARKENRSRSQMAALILEQKLGRAEPSRAEPVKPGKARSQT